MAPVVDLGTALGRVLLGVALLCLSVVGMVAFAFWWGSADGVIVLMLGLLVACVVGGSLYKRHLDRQDRA